MRLKAFILAALATVSASQATGQTNSLSEFRIVNGKIYDVNKSPQWKTIEIPKGAAIRNSEQSWPSASLAVAKKLSFDGTIRPQTVVFQIPGVYGPTKPIYAVIFNYPYSPTDFVSGTYKEEIVHGLTSEIVPGIIVPKSFQIRVFQASKATTNWDALGRVTIIPARPEFDYGLPATNAPAQPELPQEPELNISALQGDIQITVERLLNFKGRVIYSLGGMELPSKLTIYLNVKNLSGTRKVDFTTWRGSGTSTFRDYATLTDNFQNQYKRYEDPTILTVYPYSLYPSQTIQDVLEFEPPLTNIEWLHLELPGNNFGGAGVVRFEIPASKIESM